MRDFFESNRFRRGTSAVAFMAAAAPALIGAAGSIAGGMLSSAGGKKAAKEAQKEAGINEARGISNQLRINQALQAQAAGASKLGNAGAISSAFGTGRTGLDFNGEFLNEGQARERGLINEVSEQIRIRQSGDDTFDTVTRTEVDPRLTRSSRTGLSPELESIRQQALGFQGRAGRALQAGFQGIDKGLATRELDLLNQLAGPREQERREQLFSMLQRTGQLESTPGASIFSGAEEAFAREGLKRELSARDIARQERDNRFNANLDLFGLGNQTTTQQFNIEQALANRLMLTGQGGQGNQQMLPINVANFSRSPSDFRQGGLNTQQALGSALAGLSNQFASSGFDFGGLFGGKQDTGSGPQEFLASPQQAFGNTKSTDLFGSFASE